MLEPYFWSINYSLWCSWRLDRSTLISLSGYNWADSAEKPCKRMRSFEEKVPKRGFTRSLYAWFVLRKSFSRTSMFICSLSYNWEGALIKASCSFSFLVSLLKWPSSQFTKERSISTRILFLCIALKTKIPQFLKNKRIKGIKTKWENWVQGKQPLIKSGQTTLTLCPAIHLIKEMHL